MPDASNSVYARRIAAYRQGWGAYKAVRSIDTNPYPIRKDVWYAWEEGWFAADSNFGPMPPKHNMFYWPKTKNDHA